MEKSKRIQVAKDYLDKHQVAYDANSPMSTLEKAVEQHKIHLRKEKRAELKQEKQLSTQTTYNKLNKDNLEKSLLNSKGTPENPFKVCTKFKMTLSDFENALDKDQKKIFEVHKENWLGTKLNQPTMSVANLNFYKEEFNINLERENRQQFREEDEYDDEEIN